MPTDAASGDAVTFSALKPRPAGDPADVALFAIVRNEMYFLPHLLRHYRALGLREFCFLDDRSDDGTRAFLMAQPDCVVIESNKTFGEQIGKLRFAEAVKTMLDKERAKAEATAAGESESAKRSSGGMTATSPQPEATNLSRASAMATFCKRQNSSGSAK